jgi:uncharacterized protein (DUF362 family)
LEFFSRQGKEIIVADGPSIDVGDTKKVIQNHALNAVCTECGIPLIDLTCEEMVMVETGGGFELELSAIALNHNFIVSLPVLKRHFVCGLTGALKNQFGFLSHPERLKLHTHKDINRAIAELNTIVKPAFYILDAIQTLIGAQEVRHGGRIREVGYILAGEDPVSLDVVGLELLKKVEPRLEGKQPEDIPYIKHAIDLRVGEPKHFRICEL